MEAGVIADLFAFAAILFDPAMQALAHQIGVLENLAVDLALDLERIAAIDEDGGAVAHHQGGPGRAGKARRPQQALIAVGQVLVVVLVLMRDQETVQAEIGQRSADLGNILAAIVGAALNVESLGNHLGHGADTRPAGSCIQWARFRPCKSASGTCACGDCAAQQRWASRGQTQEFAMLYGIDDWRYMNANAMINRALDRSRERAGVKAKPRTTDVDAFLANSGLSAKRR